MSQAQNEFADALVAFGPHERIPTQQQIFGPFVGKWRLLATWFDADGRVSRREKGEWHFHWILSGMAIQDVWIVPPRDAHASDAERYEYGTSVRFFDSRANAWQSTWIGPIHGVVIRFIARQMEDKVVLDTVSGQEPRMRWTFSDISAGSFHWSNEIWDHNSWRLQQAFECKRSA
jgi:hypothetical protein